MVLAVISKMKSTEVLSYANGIKLVFAVRS
jgi:hypothetical protein